MNYDDNEQNVGIVLPKPIAITLKVIGIIISIPFIIALFFIMISSGKEFINYSICFSLWIIWNIYEDLSIDLYTVY